MQASLSKPVQRTVKIRSGSINGKVNKPSIFEIRLKRFFRHDRFTYKSLSSDSSASMCALRVLTFASKCRGKSIDRGRRADLDCLVDKGRNVEQEAVYLTSWVRGSSGSRARVPDYGAETWIVGVSRSLFLCFLSEKAASQDSTGSSRKPSTLVARSNGSIRKWRPGSIVKK